MKKNALLAKVIFKRTSRLTFIFAVIGFLFGWVILLFSIDYYYKIRDFLYKSRSQEYLVISKPVDLTVKKTFNPTEIAQLQQQPFIRRVGIFYTSQFDVHTTGNLMIPIQTELFFEAIDSSFIDAVPEQFVWQPGSLVVPVILSRDFINMYNFGFALVRNLPQVPPHLALLAPALNATIAHQQKIKDIQIKIVGFTDRISSILVPLEFLNWANEFFGVTQPEPARLMLEVDHVANQSLLDFLKDHNYVTKQDNLQSSKLVQMAFLLVFGVAGLGLIFVFLALMIFLANTKTMLLESKHELQLLMQLGYSPSFLHRFVFFRLFFVLVLNFVLSWLIFGFLNSKLIVLLTARGLSFSSEIHVAGYWVSAFVFGGIVLLSNYFTRQQFER